MNSKIDTLLHPIEIKNGNDAVHGGTYIDSLPYWQGRAYAEISFARDVSERNGGKFDGLVLDAAKKVSDEFANQQYVSEETVRQIEKDLEPLGKLAKEYKLHCIAHAHIDMNWMWGYDETVNVVLSNIATVLALLKEYPQFTFAQSQASVYEIIEKYGSKQMLEDVKKYVHEGRWEVTASNWVENDKNMPNGESLVRQTLITRNYLSELLEIDPDSLCVDFEPDTFGHNENMPEILAKTGIKYLYYNRGTREVPYFSRWKGQNGESILCYRDTSWYSYRIESIMTDRALLAADASGQKNLLNIYGTGDHGGGATRRDINSLIDMQSWPIYPTILFSTYKSFFEAVDSEETCIEEVAGEKNVVFTGCYTTQSRIKLANRTAERVLGEGEKFSAFEALLGGKYPTEKYCKAWKKILFCQFHDILTGSCVRDSREFAMAEFQHAMSYANTERSYALRNIADKIDTSAFICDEDISNDTAFGGGVGATNSMYGNYSSCAASGKHRVYTFFNSADCEREEVTEVTVWDWKEPELIKFTDENGNTVPHQVIEGGFKAYWGHYYTKVLVKVKVPALGYTCLFLSEADDVLFRRGELGGDRNRQHFEDKYVLENDFARIEFDTLDGTIISWFDKRNGKELIDPVRCGGIFRFVTEDTDRGMTSWRISRYKNIVPLTENVRIRQAENGELRNSLLMECEFGQSRLSYTVSLDENSPALKYTCTCDWHEIGTREKGVPQLNFIMPLSFPAEQYTYDIPFGLISRKSRNIDCPGNSFIFAADESDENKSGIMLFTDSKYGYRGTDDSIAVTLLRSAYEPDPYPENGIFNFTIALVPFEKSCPDCLVKTAFALNNPFNSVCQNAGKGELPVSMSFMEVEGNSAQISAVKMDEKTSNSLIVRLYNPSDDAREVTLRLFKAPKSAEYTDALENPTEKSAAVSGNTVKIDIGKKGFETVKIDF